MADVHSRVKLTDLDISETIIGQVTNHFVNEVQKELAIDAEQKGRCCKQFEEVFRRVVKANTQCAGQPVESNGARGGESETNDEDGALREEFNSILYPQLTSAVVEVALMRKTYPPMCCRHIRQGFDSQMEDVRAELGAAKEFTVTSSPPLLHPDEDEFLQLARCSSADLAHFKKNADPIAKRAGRLKLAQAQWKKNRNPPKAEER